MPLPPDSVLLDTAWPDADGESAGPLLFTQPERVLTAHALAEIPPLLAALDRVTADGYHAAGYLAYEAGYAFEQIAPHAPSSEPLAWLGVYRTPQRPTENEVERLLAEGGYELTEPTFALDRATYRERIARVKAHIRAGDVYQINFTAPFRFDVEGDPGALYRVLRHRQRVGYGALVRAGEWFHLSPGVVHRDVNPRDADQRYLLWLTGSEPRTVPAAGRSRSVNTMVFPTLPSAALISVPSACTWGG